MKSSMRIEVFTDCGRAVAFVSVDSDGNFDIVQAEEEDRTVYFERSEAVYLARMILRLAGDEGLSDAR